MTPEAQQWQQFSDATDKWWQSLSHNQRRIVNKRVGDELTHGERGLLKLALLSKPLPPDSLP